MLHQTTQMSMMTDFGWEMTDYRNHMTVASDTWTSLCNKSVYNNHEVTPVHRAVFRVDARAQIQNGEFYFNFGHTENHYQAN